MRRFIIGRADISFRVVIYFWGSAILNSVVSCVWCQRISDTTNSFNSRWYWRRAIEGIGIIVSLSAWAVLCRRIGSHCWCWAHEILRKIFRFWTFTILRSCISCIYIWRSFKVSLEFAFVFYILSSWNCWRILWIDSS